MEPKREVAVWPNASRTVSAGGASIANSPTNSPQRRKGQATTMVTSPPVKRVKKPTVHPLTNKPSFVYIRPRLNKDRSLRRAVVERKLLTNNGLIAHDTPTQILRKTSNRAYNPHRPMIVHEGRKRVGGGGEGGSGSGANVVNGLALPPPMISSGVEGHIGRGHHGPVAQAATTSPSGQATSVLGTNAQSGKSTNYAVATPRSMGGTGTVDSPPPQRLVHRSTLAARVESPQSSRVGGGVSTRDTSHQWTRNTFLVRKKTLRQISEDTKEKAAPSARVAGSGTTRKKIKPSVASTSKAPPAPKPLLNVGLSLQKMEPYTPESKLSSSSSSAKSDGPVVHGGSSSSGRNVSTQNAMLARGNPASLRKPPRASEAVGTSAAASSRVVPHKRAANPVLQRQDTMLIEQTRESDVERGSVNDKEGVHRNDKGDDNEEDAQTNKSASEEDEYDEIATFNDFFPDDKIELPASVANFKITQIYSMTPPEGFTGTQAEWLETMYEGLSEEVEVLKTLALHTQTHASNAHTETLLAEKELRQVTKLVETLESGLRERGGEECWESYQEALAAAEEDSSEEEDPLPEPLEMEEEDSLSEPLDMEVDFEDELRRNPKNRIIPREAGGNREYIVTPPLSDDEVDDAHSESPVPSSHSNDENRAPVDPSSPTVSPILSSRANVPGHIIKDARADAASALVHGCKRTREEDSPDNDDSHIIYRKNENNDESADLVRKDPRPVVKRMRVPFSSSSSSGKDIKKLESGAGNTNQEKTSCTRKFDEGTRTGPSSTLEPGSSVGAQADVQAARPIKPLPAPRIIRTAIAMARSLFSSSSKPIAEVEVIDVDMLPSPKRPVPPKIQTRPPVTEHEVIDVDAYELTGNVSMGQAGPSTRPQRQADLGTTVVIPRRRTITPRSVRHPRVFARRSVGRGSANARAGGSRSGLTSGERVVRGVVSASVPGAVTVREKVEKWLRRTSIDILEQLEFRGRS